MGMGLRPNLMCIGGLKTGSSWFAAAMNQHPDIFIPAQKELNILHYNDCDERIEEYDGYFSDSAGQQYLGDFSVRYLASANAIENAQKYLKDPRLLCIVRDPVEQVVSNYWHLVKQNFHQAKAVQDRPSLIQSLERFSELLVEPVLYGKHLNRWLQCYGKDRIFVFDNARLRDEPTSLMSEIWTFLELSSFDIDPDSIQLDTSELRLGAKPKDSSMGKIYPSLYSWVVRGPYRWFKNTFGVQAAENMKRRLKLAQASRKLFFEEGYPEPTEAEVAAIHKIVELDQRQLIDMKIVRS